MMNEIVFRPSVTICPECGLRLTAHRAYRRTVRSVSMGEFIAVHRLMHCSRHGTVFRSELLESIIRPYCTYSNDVMTEAAKKRFIAGRSCSEISSELNSGISESHVRLLSNTALDIFSRIHEESYPKLRSAMNSYILQIDGTTDSEFEMVVVARDAISDFTLYAEKSHSESLENVTAILLKVRDRYGIPSGAVSDMRSGMLKALAMVFPDIPIRICLFHFLRDLGKDLMNDLHLDLGAAMNRTGIKSPLKAILRSIPDYDQKTLYEIEQGFCTGRENMEIMAIRRILENLLSASGSSGYGFPFSLRHLNFFTACKEAAKKFADLSGGIREEKSLALLGSIMTQINRITGNPVITDMAGRIADINMLFQKIRSAFRMPEKGNLSDDAVDDDSIHDQCNLVIGEMSMYLKADIPHHMFTAAKHIIARYRQREAMLFANNADHTMPRTNNMMERFFRKVTRGIRKRCGNINAGNILSQSGASLALFQNMDNPEYVKIVFGDHDIPAVFAKHRKPFRTHGMTKSRKLKLVDAGTEMIFAGSLHDTPYNDRQMEIAYAPRNMNVS